MSGQQVRLHHLVGRKVRDADGAIVGRIHEMHVEIELHEHGNDYVVREFQILSVGMREIFGGSGFLRELLRTLGLLRARTYTVPWDVVDLSDPTRPALTIPKQRLPNAEA